MSLRCCDLIATTRSAVVCFGKPTCALTQCRIQSAGVHGICARGECQIRLVDCQILDSTIRAIYAYANANVSLLRCSMEGTLRKDKAAIEVVSMSSSEETGPSNNNCKTTSVFMEDCRFDNNRGVDVRILGPVHQELDDNTRASCKRDGLQILPNGDHLTTPQERTVEDNTSVDPVLRRDEADSSFRRGDWWCPTCQPPKSKVVLWRRDQCPVCRAPKTEGCLLSVSEVRNLNAGVLEVPLGDSTIVTTVTVKDVPMNSNSQWLFDAGDEKGWLVYDGASTEILETAYRKWARTNDMPHGETKTVTLAGGKYHVNLESMEQVNVETQFLRLIKRVET